MKTLRTSLQTSSFILAFLLMAVPMEAQPLYWDSNAATPGAGATPTGTWGTSLFWSTDPSGSAATAAWTAGGNAVFSAGTDASGAFTVTLSGTQTAGSVTVEEGTNTFGGSGAVSIGTGTVTVNSGALLSIDSSARIAATTGAKFILNGGTMRNSSTATSGSFVDGDAEIVLGTGGGILSANGGSAAQVIVQTPSSVISGTGPLTKVGNAAVAIATACTYSGPTIINDGTLRVRTTSNRLPIGTDVTVNSPGALDPGSTSDNIQQVNTINGNGNITFSASSTLLIAGSGDSTLTGLISDGASFGRISKRGAGTLTLSGLNTYDGRFTNDAGTTTITAGAAWCGPACDAYMNGGIVNLNNTAQTILSIAGAGGTVNLGPGHTLTVNNGSSKTYSGIFAGSGALTKTGTGNFTISGPNTYDGDTTIIGTGTITVGSGTALGSTVGKTVVPSGAGLNFSGANFTINEPIDIAGVGNAVTTGGAIFAQVSSTVTFGGTITLTADANVGVAGTSAATFNNATAFTAADKNLTLQGGSGAGLKTVSGVIALGSGGLTKLQGGTWTLSGANTYSGPTAIGAGTLRVANTAGSATGSGDVTVAAGATLAGPGIIAGSVSVTGTISAGTSPGTITTGSETWNGGGSYLWEINDATGTIGADPGWDLIHVNGDLNITATPASKFNVNVRSLTLANANGNAANFNQSTDYLWTILRVTGTIFGFDPAAFNLNTSTFSNAVTGAFFIEQNGTNIDVHYIAGRDFGDAPDPTFPTLLANNGARHVLVPGFFLGASIDAESDGQPTATANGDDSTGTDDEDGVTFTTPILPGQMATVEVVASAAGQLDAWLDFNGNGSWADAGEQIFTNVTLSAGNNVLVFQVPLAALPANTTARFRFSTAGNLAFDGQAADGEVEDYLPSILPAADLILAKTGLPEPVGQGSNLTYTITVKNSGPSMATAVSLVDTLPPETTFVSASSGCANVLGTVTCSLGDLAANDITNVTIVVTVNPCQGGATNMATVSSATTDTDLANNSVTVTNTITDQTPPAIVCPANLAVQCDADVPPANFSGGSVNDNCDPNPAVTHAGDSSTGTNPKIITRTYKAMDASGNVSTCDQTITVQDTMAPALTACPANILAQDPENDGEVVTYTAPTATDCEGAVSVNCVPPSGNTFALGTNTVVCSAVDSVGNSNFCTFTVTVVLDCGLQAQVYVDDDYANNQNGDMVNFPDNGAPGPHTIGCDAFATMQGGADATSSGGTLNVAAGTYPELVTVSTPMTLLGANAGIDPRVNCHVGPARGPESIIDGMGIETAILFQSSGITLDGFTIQGGCCDAYTSGLHMGGGFDNNHVLNNIITDNSIGIFANCAGPMPTEIRRNLINANNRPGPSGGAGIYVDGSVNLQILENEITGHTDNHPLLAAATTAGAHTGLVVTENNFHDNAYGLFVLGVNGGTFSRNQFSLLDGTCLAFFGGSSGVDVLNNIFVSLDASNTRGVRIRDDGYGLGNDIDIEIHRNSFTGFGSISGTAFAVGIISGYTGTLDASANWWGVATPAGVPSKIDSSGGPVDYTPWLVTGVEPVPDVCDGFQGDFSTLEVDAASPQSTPLLGRVQEGINLVTVGGTVKIVGGTYGPPESADASAASVTLAPGASTAQVTINGDMTLNGNDTLEFELNGTTPGTDFDQFVVNGMVNLGSATFSATAGFAYPDCTTLTLIDNDAGDPVSGTFAGLPNGSLINIGGNNFKIFYDGGDGNDVVLVKDTTPPTITCPANFVVSDNNSPSGSEVVTYTPTVTDNCPGGMTNCVPASGSTFPLGVTMVTCTATDSGGNTATCSFTIVVCDPNQPTTYVDDDYANNQVGDMVNFPDDGNPGPHVVGCDAFATVQGGITAVNVGGTVNVAAGTYTENVSITKSVILLGAQSGVDARGRSASESIVMPATASSPTFDVALNGTLTIDGFSFSGGTALGVIQTTVNPNNNMQIVNNRFSGYSQSAVFMNRGGSDITIARNVMDGSNIAGSGQAIFASSTQSYPGLNIADNWIINNKGRYGFFVDGNHNVGESATRAPSISGNLFDNNLQGLNLGSRSFGTLGTPVLGTYGGIIGSNIFRNSTANGIQAGIQHVLVSGNTFSNNAASGLVLTSFGNAGADRGAQNSTITCNTFGANGSEGIFLSSDQAAGTISGNHFNFNNIAGNTVGLTYNGTETIDAKSNWWGSATGPTIASNPGGTGDKITNPSGSVGYTPFLTQDTSFPQITCPADIMTTNDLGQCSAVVTYAPTASSPPCCPGSVTVGCDPPSGSAFPVGTNMVTCSATNACGKAATCTFAVIVKDAEAPMLSACASNITTTNDSGQCSAMVTYTPPTATDNCTNVTVMCSPPSGSTFAVGPTTVTCTATDSASNTNSCTFTVTVNDTQPPSITCPTNMVLNADAGQCSKSNVTYTTTATDNCTNVTVVCNPTNGSAFPVGMTTVSCVATDGAGKTNGCSFVVNVVDNEAPMIACPANVTVPTDAGTCTATNVNLGTPTTSDNCGVAGVTNDAPAQYPRGMTFVTWKATDIHGNMNTCTQKVTVADMEQPQITCPSNVTVSCDQSINPTNTGRATGTDNCDCLPNPTNCDPNPAISFMDSNAVEVTGSSLNGWALSTTDGGTPPNTATAQFVTGPATPPLGIGSAQLAVGTNGNGAAQLRSTTYDGTLVSSLTELRYHTYRTQDGSGGQMAYIILNVDLDGNGSTDDLVFFEPEYQKPVYNPSLPDQGPLLTGVWQSWNALAGGWWSLNGLGGLNPGTGVKPLSTYIAANPTARIAVNAAGAVRLVAGFGAGAWDNFDGNVDGFTIGINGQSTTYDFEPSAGNTCANTLIVRTWKATDASGNMSSCTQLIRVVDTNAPSLTCSPVMVNADPGQCSAVVNYSVPVSDNCDTNPTVVCVPAPGTAFPVGTNTVNCTAYDACGNSNTCSFIVTVLDNQAPIVTCSSNIVVECATPAGTAVNYSSSATDNCDITVTCAPPSGSVFPPGTNTVICSAIDSRGNSNGCSFTVTVGDTTPPFIPPPTFAAGTVDNFTGPEPASPSAGLAAFLSGNDLKGFDDCSIDHTLAHSFTNLPRYIDGATLRIRMRACPGSLSENDTINLVFAQPDGNLLTPKWRRRIGTYSVDMVPGLLPGEWSPGTQQEFVFDLSNLPNADGSFTNLIPTLRAERFLDLYVQDDTDVDYVILEIQNTRCLDDIVVDKDPAQCGTNVTFTVPYMDNCDTNVTVVCTPPSGSFFTVGSNTTVTCTATDDIGNTNACTFIVYVDDPTPPVLSIERGPASTVMISWPVGSPCNYRLEEVPFIPAGPAFWTPTPEPVIVMSGRYTVTVSIGSGNKFFRLRYP